MNLYFNNAATTWPKPAVVVKAVREAMEQCLGNPGRSSGNQGLRLIYQTRKTIARLFNIPDTSRIVFTHNATHAINLGLKGFLKPGAHVVTTSMEHNAVARPLHAMEMSNQITCDILPCSSEGFLNPGSFRAAIMRQKPDLAVINHASNVNGAIQDLTELGRLAGEFGVPLMADCSQSAGIIPVDIQASNIALMAVPGHKGLLGPSGTGFLYISPELDLNPVFQGGTGSFSEQLTMPETMPDRFESGTLNFHGLAGLKAAVEYILARTIGDIHQHEASLMTLIRKGCEKIEGVQMVPPVDVGSHLAVLSITAEGCDLGEICNILEIDFGINTRAGLHCSPWAHETIDTYPEGTLRISPGPFTAEEDIGKLLEALDETIRKIRR